VEKSVVPDDPEEQLDLEDPMVSERATVDSDAEQKTMELFHELTEEEGNKIREAVKDLWGQDAVAMLPMSLK